MAVESNLKLVDPFVLDLVEELEDDQFGNVSFDMILTNVWVEWVIKKNTLERKDVFKQALVRCIQLPNSRSIVPDVMVAMSIWGNQNLGRNNDLSYEQIVEELVESEIFKMYCRDFIKQHIIYFL